MPDYSEPVTPVEVCERIEDALGFHVQRLRREAEILLAKADAIEHTAKDVVFRERCYYERYQPRESGRAEAAAEADDNGSSGVSP